MRKARTHYFCFSSCIDHFLHRWTLIIRKEIFFLLQRQCRVFGFNSNLRNIFLEPTDHLGNAEGLKGPGWVDWVSYHREILNIWAWDLLLVFDVHLNYNHHKFADGDQEKHCQKYSFILFMLILKNPLPGIQHFLLSGFSLRPRFENAIIYSSEEKLKTYPNSLP